MPLYSSSASGKALLRPGDSGKASSGSSLRNPAPVNNATPHDKLIVFLCPNGHKLNGPARMKGMAGQCPHCGAKFRIPAEDDEEELESFAEDQHVADSLSDEEFASADVAGKSKIRPFADEPLGLADGLEPFEQAPPSVFDAFTRFVANDVHPHAAVLSRLWQAKEPGQQIDLYLDKGEVFTPEFFAEGLSQAAFGVFGRKEKEGGYTLTMIPWANIVRMEIRGVKLVPFGILK